jgi:hypothetical protein
MRSMQCNMEFGYQLSIRSGTKENHVGPRVLSDSLIVMYPLHGLHIKHTSQNYFNVASVTVAVIA